MAVYKYRAYIQLEDDEQTESSSPTDQRTTALNETLSATESILRHDVTNVENDDCSVLLVISDQYTKEEMRKDAFSRLASREEVESAVFEEDEF